MSPPTQSPPSVRLHNITAIVTGSSSGIGRGIALAYAREGATVICTDIREEPYNKDGQSVHQPSGAPPSSVEEDAATATHTLINSRYGEEKGFYIPCDIQHERKQDGSESLGVADMVERAATVTGRVDVIVNCAGVGIFGMAAHELTLEDWNRSMVINGTGPFLGSKHALVQFLKQDLDVNGFRGAIINISSIAATIGLRECAAYCAAKAAVDGFSRSIAIDYAAQGIRCNVIAPGYTATPWLQPSLNTEPGFLEYIQTWTPQQRLARPAEIAGAAVYLAAGQESGFVTGSTMRVDGGFHAR